MLSIEACRKYLDDKSLSDAEIEALRADLYEIGGIAFDAWLLEKRGSKNPVGSFPSAKYSDTV
jgi:hypothetical protein